MDALRRFIGLGTVVCIAAVSAAALAGVPAQSVARIWDEQLLAAIRKDTPKPPVHARNLFHVSAAMWDAWAAYDTRARGFLITEKQTAPGVAAARNEAISFAAYRLLKHRFPPVPLDVFGKPCHPGGVAVQAALDAQMDSLGYDKSFTSTVGSSPAALGNRIGQAYIALGLTDGANEGTDVCYGDDTDYFCSNPDLIFKFPGNPFMILPNSWQQLAFDNQVDQAGNVLGKSVQAFVGPGWGDVKPFALLPSDLPGDQEPPADCSTVLGVPKPYLDPGCPAQLGGVGDETLKRALVELIRFSSYTDPAQGVIIDASPGAIGNNSLGQEDGTGYPLNPVTGLPYEQNLVNRADWARIVAQYWSDGPKSETPPGHWNVVANEVADHPGLVKRIAGTGPVLDDLEWDVKVYLALNGAVHDAAIGAWSTKNYYDSSRPISLIRYMGGLGQSSDSSGPSYHLDGLPLVPGLIEVITEETIAPGERHEHLAAFCETFFDGLPVIGGGPNTKHGQPCVDDNDCPDDGPYDGVCASHVGKLAIFSWNGPPAEPEHQVSGAGWGRVGTWMPFFPRTFVTPPFPGYTSGHSTFSRAAAEVLTALTGSKFVPGGLESFTAVANEYLEVEDGPSETMQIQWATYYDAADQAGISRRLGGIHPFYDDYPGRVMGSAIGKKAVQRAYRHYARLTLTPPQSPGPGGRPGFAVVTPRGYRSSRVSPPPR